MSFDHLFENQPRWAEVLAGVVALLAGIFAFGFAIWLYDRDVLTGRDVAARPIALITVLVGFYALVMARRLLAARENRPAHLVSSATLVAIGLVLVAAGFLPVLFSGEAWPQAIEGLVLGGACIVLGVRRWRAGDHDAA